MKHAAVFLFFLLPVFGSGQYVVEDFRYSSMFFYPITPYARAEAMGLAYAAVDGDLNAVVYNPAALASIKGLALSGSSAGYDVARRFSGGAGVRVHDKLAVGLTIDDVRMSAPVFMTSGWGYYGPYTPERSHVRLTLAVQPFEDMFVGVNAGLLNWEPYSGKNHSFIFDIGLIKKFRFGGKSVKHNLNIGASMTNFTFSTIAFKNVDGMTYFVKPRSIVRPAFVYHLEVNKNRFSDTLNSFEVFVNSQMDIRVDNESMNFAVGAELMFFEVLSLRAGNMDLLSSYQGTFSYGLGLQLPLNKLSKLPLKLRFDYSYTPLPQYDRSMLYGSALQYYPSNNPETYSFSVNWLF